MVVEAWFTADQAWWATVVAVAVMAIAVALFAPSPKGNAVRMVLTSLTCFAFGLTAYTGLVLETSWIKVGWLLTGIIGIGGLLTVREIAGWDEYDNDYDPDPPPDYMREEPLR